MDGLEYVSCCRGPIFESDERIKNAVERTVYEKTFLQPEDLVMLDVKHFGSGEDLMAFVGVAGMLEKHVVHGKHGILYTSPDLKWSQKRMK